MVELTGLGFRGFGGFYGIRFGGIRFNDVASAAAGLADYGLGAGEGEIGLEDFGLLGGVKLEEMMGAGAGLESKRVLAGQGERAGGGERE